MMSKKQQNVNLSSTKYANNRSFILNCCKNTTWFTILRWPVAFYSLEMTASVNSAVCAEPPKSPVKRSLANKVALIADLILCALST